MLIVKEGENLTELKERLKQLRAALGLNQKDFSQKINVGYSTLAMFETGQRIPKEIHISQICKAFNVNEEWLRNGTGEMFLEVDSTIVSQLSSEYGLDAFEKVLIEGFLKMKPEERAVIKTYVRNLIDTLTTDETAYKEFRAEYDREHALPFAARGGDISGLAEAAERFNSTFPAAENKDGM